MIGTLNVTARDSHLRCAVCHAELASATTSECPACASKAHVECWQALGRCATLGCAHSVPSGTTVSTSIGHAPPSPSPWWVPYDLFFGIVLPLVCMAFDPLAMTEQICWGASEPPPLVPHVFADPFRVLVFTEIALFTLWFLFQPSARVTRTAFGLALFVGAVLAFVLGGLFLPWALADTPRSLFPGVLGFTPCFTFVAYLRNSVRALTPRRARAGASWQAANSPRRREDDTWVTAP